MRPAHRLALEELLGVMCERSDCIVASDFEIKEESPPQHQTESCTVLLSNGGRRSAFRFDIPSEPSSVGSDFGDEKEYCFTVTASPGEFGSAETHEAIGFRQVVRRLSEWVDRVQNDIRASQELAKRRQHDELMREFVARTEDIPPDAEFTDSERADLSSRLDLLQATLSRQIETLYQGQGALRERMEKLVADGMKAVRSELQAKKKRSFANALMLFVAKLAAQELGRRLLHKVLAEIWPTLAGILLGLASSHPAR